MKPQVCQEDKAKRCFLICRINNWGVPCSSHPIREKEVLGLSGLCHIRGDTSYLPPIHNNVTSHIHKPRGQHLWGTRNHCCFILELWLISFPNIKMTSAIDWMTNLVMPRGKRNPSWNMSSPHKEKSVRVLGVLGVPEATPRKLSVCKWDSSAGTHRHGVLIWPMGGWGATQKVPLCERWDEGKELFPSHGPLPGSGAEQSDLSPQWPARPGFKSTPLHPLEPQAQLWSLDAGCPNSRRHLHSVVRQCWAGASHSSQPAACSASVRSLHPFLGSFTPPDRSLCRLHHCFWSRLWAQAKNRKLAHFWETIHSFPAEGLVLWRKRY